MNAGNIAVESFIRQFFKTLFTDADIEKALSFFAPNALCSGYLGYPGMDKIADLENILIDGKKNGLVNLCCENLNCHVADLVPGMVAVLSEFTLKDNNSTCREMRKRCSLILSIREASFRIHLFNFSLVSQTGFIELMNLDTVDASLRNELLRSKLRFDAAVQHTALSLWEYDIRGKCIHQKDNAIEMHGFDLTVENVPESLIESGYVHPESADEFLAMYEKLFAGEKQAGGVFRVLDNEHKHYWWEKITYINEFDTQGNPVRAIGFSTDVSEHVEAQNKLKRISLQKQTLARNAILTAILDVTADRILDIDIRNMPENRTTGINSCTELIDLFTEKLVDPVYRAEMEKLLNLERIKKTCHGGKTAIQTDYQHIMPGGEKIWAMIFIELEPDENNGHLIANCYIENIDKRKKKEIRMKKDAEQDPLTRTYNRLAFKVLAENILGKTETGHLSVFGLLDIDDFKNCNDEVSHLYGDAVLIRVADVLKKCFRQNDIVGRLGGDEFVFILDNVANMDFIKKKIHSLFRELQHTDDHITRPIYISLGIAIAPWDGNEFETLYRKADIALYAAKRGGKNRWCIYDEL